MYKYIIYDMRVLSYYILNGITPEDYVGDPDIVFDSSNKYNYIISKKNKHTNGITELYFEDNYLVLRNGQEWELTIFKNGKQILINEKCKDLQCALSILLGTGLSLLMLYRNRIPLHASGIVMKDNVIGFMGRSGVGKSTFLRFLLQKGYKVLTEDTLLIENKGNIEVIPTRNIKAKLKGDTISYLKIDACHVGEYIDKGDKYWVEIPKENRCLDRKYLKHVYILQPQDDNTDIYINKIEGRDKYTKLRENTNCIRNLPAGDASRVIKSLQFIAKEITVFEICYPLGIEFLDKILECIIKNEETDFE